MPGRIEPAWRSCMAQRLLHYDVLERLGEGARSVIYAVMDPQTRQIYALKHVIRADPKDLRFVEQMETEFEVSKQLSHPNLRKSYELKINKSMLIKVTEAFLVMELFDGTPLEIRPPSTMPDIIDTFTQAAQGLKALHQAGYVHCDIKPNNILRSDTGLVKIIDFGQACKIGTTKERIQGTPDYIAPEQVNRKPISIQTDVFNLGATLYWVLTGRNIPTMYTINKKGGYNFVLHATIPAPSELNPRVPAALSRLTMDMVATQTSKRPADMDQVIQRLELVRHQLATQKTTDDAAAATAEAPVAGATPGQPLPPPPQAPPSAPRP